MLMDAAVRILAKSDLHEMFVVDVLSEAGLSTRSFYRHFESKDDLLRALVLRATRVGGFNRWSERSIVRPGRWPRSKRGSTGSSMQSSNRGGLPGPHCS